MSAAVEASSSSSTTPAGAETSRPCAASTSTSHRGDLRLPRPERRRQVDDGSHADDADDDHVGLGASGRRRRGRESRRGAHGESAWRSRRRGSIRVRPVASCSCCRPGCSAVSRAAAVERARGTARARRSRRRRRPPDQGLLGRHEAPARPGLGAGPRARGAVPRRADDRSRPGQPADGVGRGAAHQRAGHDGVPHDAVPRGGRPAVRPAGDHRRRQDRARGNARRR